MAGSVRPNVAGTLVALMILSGGVAIAKPRVKLLITDATADFATHTLTVNGKNFGADVPSVTLGTTPLTVLSVTTTRVVATLPASTPAGSYRLVVARGPSTNQTGIFDLTIGTTGPQGPQGPKGPIGPPGSQSVTAGDSSISIGGTVANSTIAVAANGITNANVANGALSPAKIAGFAATLGPNSFAGTQSIDGDLLASGNVGVGTTSPAADLHIFRGGNPDKNEIMFQVSRGGPAELDFVVNAAKDVGIGINPGTNPVTALPMTPAHLHLFRGGNPDKNETMFQVSKGRPTELDFVVNAAKDVGIGINPGTNPVTALPMTPAHFHLFRGGNPEPTEIMFQVSKGLPDVPDFVITGARRIGIGTMTPTATLDVASGGTTLADAWTVRSSARLKTNTQVIVGALATVAKLRGVTYDRTSDGKHDIGLIAEEVATVVPELVSFDTDTKQAQGVDYARLTALLIEAVKEQQAQITRQRAAVQRQESEIRTLTADLARLRTSLRRAKKENAKLR